MCVCVPICESIAVPPPSSCAWLLYHKMLFMSLHVWVHAFRLTWWLPSSSKTVRCRLGLVQFALTILEVQVGLTQPRLGRCSRQGVPAVVPLRQTLEKENTKCNHTNITPNWSTVPSGDHASSPRQCPKAGLCGTRARRIWLRRRKQGGEAS